MENPPNNSKKKQLPYIAKKNTLLSLEIVLQAVQKKIFCYNENIFLAVHSSHDIQQSHMTWHSMCRWREDAMILVLPDIFKNHCNVRF